MTHIRTLMDQMIEIDEGRMKDIFTADQEGKSAKEIAKALKLPLGTVKRILGEEEELKEFTDSQLDVLARHYKGLAGKTISIDQANKLRKIFKGVPDRSLDALRRKKIPFLSGLALSRMVQKGMPVKESNLDADNVDKEKDTSKEKELKIKLDKEKDQDALEKQLVAAQGQINVLKQKLENEKNKVTKPEPNKETGEVPLTVGIAHKYLKDKKEKEQEKKEDVKEAFAVQITKKDGGKLIHGKYKDKAAADKFVKWYKTGDMKDTKSIEVVKEMAKDDAYAIGMAQAKKSMNDEPPLEKKTITKGHEIAKKILAKEGKAPFRLSYDDRYGKHAGFEDAKTLADLQNKAANLRKKGFVINKMGRNTSPVKEETIIEFTSQQIKQAYGIANDPRYKAGNYDGAVKAIEKIAKGLSKHPDVAKVLKRTNENAHAGARLVFETIKGIKNKAEKSGMPYSILKKVYDRGMAAWRGGHRPGTTQQQWAFARVNSFVTKSSGTWGGADKDLAKQVRGKN